MGDAMKALEPTASSERNASRNIILAFGSISLLSFGIILSDFMSEEGSDDFHDISERSRGCQKPLMGNLL